MAELVAGGTEVSVAGLRFRARGFNGVVEETVDVPVQRDRGDADGAPEANRGLLAALADAPDEAFHVGQAVRVQGEGFATRDADAPELTTELTTTPGRVPILLSQDEDGFLSWELPQNHDELIEAGASRSRDAAPLVARFVVPMDPPTPSVSDAETRGVVSLVAKKVFRVVSAALFDRMIEAGGERLAQWMERDRQHALRTFGPDDYQSKVAKQLDARALAELARGGPAVLFIHGTNNLSHGAFHSVPQSYMKELSERYEGRVLAFDHPTLSVDPVENARWLAENLLTGLDLELDIISHSRGGLVARELAERGAILGLDERFKVRSLAMVGTPNRGTPLCEPAHLAKYVDTLTNLLSAIPDNGVTDALDAIVGALSHVARKAYEGIPGVMAMNPKGDYLATLNKAAPTRSRAYLGISTNYEPTEDAGWRRRLRDVVFDAVFTRAPNDLVVPTASVGDDTFLAHELVLPSATGVDHSTYWPNDQVRAALNGWFSREGNGRAEAVVAAAAAASTPAADPIPTPTPTPTVMETQREAAAVTSSLESRSTPRPSRFRRSSWKSCTEVSNMRASRSASGISAARRSRAGRRDTSIVVSVERSAVANCSVSMRRKRATSPRSRRPPTRSLRAR